MTKKRMATILGAGITLITLTNFIPALSIHSGGYKLLFGLFMTSELLVTLHLMTGVIALIVSLFTVYSRWFLLLAGIVFAFIAIAGFAGGNTVLGVFPVNTADNFLHTIFVVAFLGTSLTLKNSNSRNS